MSLKKIIASALGSSAGKALLAWGRTDAERAIAAIKNSATGAAIEQMVKDAEASGKPGPEKLAIVLIDAGPLVAKLLQLVGVLKSPAEVETLTRAVVESTVADLKSGSLAAAILKALGA